MFARGLEGSGDSADRRGRLGVLVVCGAVVSVLSFVDYWVSPALSTWLFYLFPVSWAAWRGGRWAGRAFAVAAAALWGVSYQLSDPSHGDWLIDYWNLGVRLAYFVVVVELIGHVRQLLERERRRSETDLLTGVFNRAGWFEAAEISLASARRSAEPVAVAYLDVDDFKRINDTLGHGEGDRVLAEMAAVLRGSVRRSDVVARLGGDEFVVLLTGVSPDAAQALGDKMHAALSAAVADRGWPIGFSIGIAAFETPPGSVHELVTRADSVMYDVKRAGKNAVRVG